MYCHTPSWLYDHHCKCTACGDGMTRTEMFERGVWPGSADSDTQLPPFRSVCFQKTTLNTSHSSNLMDPIRDASASYRRTMHMASQCLSVAPNLASSPSALTDARNCITLSTTHVNLAAHHQSVMMLSHSLTWADRFARAPAVTLTATVDWLPRRGEKLNHYGVVQVKT